MSKFNVGEAILVLLPVLVLVLVLVLEPLITLACHFRLLLERKEKRENESKNNSGPVASLFFDIAAATFSAIDI